MDFLHKGGPVLWVIIGLSVVTFTLIIERLLFFYRIKTKDEFLTNFFSLIEEGKYEQAIDLSKNTVGPVARVLNHGMQNKGLPKERQKENLELYIMKETPKLASFIDFIAVSTTAAPILGLLGTVTGMIKVFNTLSRSGSPDPLMLSMGIAEALITTEAGLVVALPCLFLHNFLANAVENLSSDMKHEGMKLISFFD